MLSVAYSWLLPPVKTGVTNAILGNWQIRGSRSWVSGAPLQVVGGTSAELQHRRHEARRAIRSATQHQRLARHPGDAGADVRSARQRRHARPRQVLRGAGGRSARQLHLAEHHRAVVHRTTTCRLFKNFPIGGNRKFQFRLSAYNVFNHPQRAIDDPTNLTLNFTNGVHGQRELRPAAAGQQVRPSHRPDGVQVLLLGQRPWDGRAEAPTSTVRYDLVSAGQPCRVQPGVHRDARLFFCWPDVQSR